jgi:hypothetical protein
LFVYETFLYLVAALLRTGADDLLHEVLTSHYLLPDTVVQAESSFDTFDAFYAHSDTLQSILAPEGRRLYSPAAELIKRQADRVDIPFPDVIQADLLALLVSFITPGTDWYPQTLHYASYTTRCPFFARAAQHKNYLRLVTITGIADAGKLRELVKDGQVRLQVGRWTNFHFIDRLMSSYLNLDNLDTIS